MPTDKIVVGRNEVPACCGTCNGPLQIGGPIWHDKIHNIEFVKKMHAACKTEYGKKFVTIERIKGVLGGIIDEEVLADRPLSFDLN